MSNDTNIPPPVGPKSDAVKKSLRSVVYASNERSKVSATSKLKASDVNEEREDKQAIDTVDRVPFDYVFAQHLVYNDENEKHCMMETEKPPSLPPKSRILGSQRSREVQNKPYVPQRARAVQLNSNLRDLDTTYTTDDMVSGNETLDVITSPENEQTPGINDLCHPYNHNVYYSEDNADKFLEDVKPPPIPERSDLVLRSIRRNLGILNSMSVQEGSGIENSQLFFPHSVSVEPRIPSLYPVGYRQSTNMQKLGPVPLYEHLASLSMGNQRSDISVEHRQFPGVEESKFSADITHRQSMGEVHWKSTDQNDGDIFYVSTRYEPIKGKDNWESVVLSGNWKAANTLLSMGIFPSQSTLDKMCLKFGRKSTIALLVSKTICENIKKRNKNILDVWAAYTVENPNEICFVICLGDTHETNSGETAKIISWDNIIEYSFVIKSLGKYSYESSDIIKENITSFEHLTDENYSRLQECVAKHSVELMKEHKYLSVVSACNKRSRYYGSPYWKLETEDCIVLYVQTKHYIPVNEEPFKSHYGGIPVDVREGVFIPFGRTARDYLDNLQMGCQIRGEIKNNTYVEGTLGCFLDHPQYGVCGLTCAHVLLEPMEFMQLKTFHNGSLNWPLHHMCNNVYQPANPGTNIGHTVKVVFQEGTGQKSGMEVALFKITSRHPKNSEFPQPSVAGSTTMGNINYEHWRIYSKGKLNQKMEKVVKFGSNTEMRDGLIAFDAMSVKELNSYPLALNCFEIKLQKQIEVRSADLSLKFADRGDSGALVFTVGENDSEYTCIGIVEGGTSYGTVVVTPILPILEELNVPCLKSFEAENALSEIHGKLENVGNDVQTVRREVHTVSGDLHRVRHDIGNNMQRMNFDIQRVERTGDDIKRDVQAVRADVQQIKDLLLASLNMQQNPSNT